MKFSFALTAICSAALVACSHGSSSSGGSSPAPTVSEKAAAGAVNGKSMQFTSATYMIVQDSKTNANMYLVTLSDHNSGGCVGISSPTDEAVSIYAPAKVGNYSSAQATVDFMYPNNGSFQVDGANGNLVVKITTDNGSTLTGAVFAQFGSSNINGTFTASNCSNGVITGPGNNPVTGNPVPVTNGSPDPSQVPPAFATQWSDVKYAFCSAQGQYGVMIDFQGADLSKVTSGNFKMSSRPCDASSPFQLINSGTFTLQASTGKVMLDFGADATTGSENTIEIDQNAYNNGYGIMGGNSGPCALLTNEGTQNIFQGQDGFLCQ
jgi:hypothetical protein